MSRLAPSRFASLADTLSPTLLAPSTHTGGLAAAVLHMARSACRRAERSVVPLVRAELTDASVGIYLNRLSDYLFTAARYAALKAGEPEVVWAKAAPEAAAAAEGEPAGGDSK